MVIAIKLELLLCRENLRSNPRFLVLPLNLNIPLLVVVFRRLYCCGDFLLNLVYLKSNRLFCIVTTSQHFKLLIIRCFMIRLNISKLIVNLSVIILRMVPLLRITCPPSNMLQIAYESSWAYATLCPTTEDGCEEYILCYRRIPLVHHPRISYKRIRMSDYVLRLIILRGGGGV